jgi:ferredoxin
MKLQADKTKCTGCRVCQLICSFSHFNEINPKRAALTIDAHFPAPGTYEPRICNQCGTCAEVCPAEAISEKNGVYIIDTEICTGCGECVEACPSKVMFLHEDSPVPIKCDLCKECVSLCATQALAIVD